MNGLECIVKHLEVRRDNESADRSGNDRTDLDGKVRGLCETGEIDGIAAKGSILSRGSIGIEFFNRLLDIVGACSHAAAKFFRRVAVNDGVKSQVIAQRLGFLGILAVCDEPNVELLTHFTRDIGKVFLNEAQPFFIDKRCARKTSLSEHGGRHFGVSRGKLSAHQPTVGNFLGTDLQAHRQSVARACFSCAGALHINCPARLARSYLHEVCSKAAGREHDALRTESEAVLSVGSRNAGDAAVVSRQNLPGRGGGANDAAEFFHILLELFHFLCASRTRGVG